MSNNQYTINHHLSYMRSDLTTFNPQGPRERKAPVASLNPRNRNELNDISGSIAGPLQGAGAVAKTSVITRQKLLSGARMRTSGAKHSVAVDLYQQGRTGA